MWEISPERLAQAMKRADVNQSQLADLVGVKQPSIGRLLSGETKTTRALDLIAQALDTSSGYLKGLTDNPDSKADVPDRGHIRRSANPPSDTVELQEFDLAYGLGASFIHAEAVTGKMMTFSRSWIRHFTDSSFDALFWAQGIGDSMTPTIQDADVVLIDSAQRTPRIWDKLWALEVGGMGMIKRLRPTKDGTGMRLLSDGGLPEELVFDGEMQVIGRVVAIVRKV
jgi:phage repressor protein C with HTH and peptisase S24 domain